MAGNHKNVIDVIETYLIINGQPKPRKKLEFLSTRALEFRVTSKTFIVNDIEVQFMFIFCGQAALRNAVNMNFYVRFVLYISV